MTTTGSYQVSFTDPFSNPGRPSSITVENQKINVETGVKLVGKNVVDYAKPIAENFLHLLENFASGTAPSSPITGQLWYDTNINSELPQLKQPQLKVYDGTSFVPAGNVIKSVSAPTFAALGDIWVNTVTQQLFICTESSFSDSTPASSAKWILVGPQYSAGTLTGPRIDNLEDTSGQQRPVITFNVSGHTVAIISSVAFSPRSVIPGFDVIKPGINISTVDNLQQNASEINKLWGTAEKANSLVIGNLAVPSSSFLRNDQPSTTNYILNVKSNNGIKIGTGLTTSLNNTNNNETVLSNSVEGSRIYIKTNANNSLVNAITIQRNNVAIGKEIDTTKALDVGGNIGATGKLTISDTTVADLLTGSIRSEGGLSLAKNLVVGGVTSLNDTVTLKSILPASTGNFNIGSETLKFKEVHANTVKSTNFYGTFTGNFVSTDSIIQGSVIRLAYERDFKLEGELTSTTGRFDGTQNVTLNATLAAGAVSNRTLSLDSLSVDEMIINRPGVGLRKITKQTFLNNVPVIPIGTVLPFAGNTPPPGYLFCDGSEQLTSNYPELFSVIGYTYKPLGSLLGVSTFALPDFRGRFGLGRDNMNNGTTVPDKTNPSSSITTTFDKNGNPSISSDRVTNAQADSIGGFGGKESFSIEIDNLPQHSHNLTSPSTGNQYHTIGYRPETASEIIDPQYESLVNLPDLDGTVNGRWMSTAGEVSDLLGNVSSTNQPIDSMNPFLTINYIIFTGRIS